MNIVKLYPWVYFSKPSHLGVVRRCVVGIVLLLVGETPANHQLYRICVQELVSISGCPYKSQLYCTPCQRMSCRMLQLFLPVLVSVLFSVTANIFMEFLNSLNGNYHITNFFIAVGFKPWIESLYC